MTVVSRREALSVIGATALGAAFPFLAAAEPARVQSWPLKTPRRTGIHDVAPASDKGVWFTAQATGPLAGSFIERIEGGTGQFTVVEPPTKNQGARRVWSDSRGRIWVSEWVGGNLSMYDPASKNWRTFKVPGNNPQVYAVYVDDRDQVWVSEWTGNAVYRFDPTAQKFERFGFPRTGTNIRQILGRPGEVWLPESGTETISVIRTA